MFKVNNKETRTTSINGPKDHLIPPTALILIRYGKDIDKRSLTASITGNFLDTTG